MKRNSGLRVTISQDLPGIRLQDLKGQDLKNKTKQTKKRHGVANIIPRDLEKSQPLHHV